MINNQTLNIDPHIDMLNDENRLQKFYMALQKVVKSDSVVLDIGGGSGILSFLAAGMGAKKVYCVERTKTIRVAMAIAKENDYKNIVFISKDIFHSDTRQIITEKADIIVCELIGTTLLNENILKVISYAKKHFLSQNGVLIPNRLDLFAKLVHFDYMSYEKTIKILKQYDIVSYHTFDELFYNSIFHTDDTHLSMTSAKKILSIDLYAEHHKLFARYVENTKKPINALMLSFKAYLDKTHMIDTTLLEPSHWGRFFLPFKEKMSNTGLYDIDIKIAIINEQCYYSWDVDIDGIKQSHSNMFIYR